MALAEQREPTPEEKVLTAAGRTPWGRLDDLFADTVEAQHGPLMAAAHIYHLNHRTLKGMRSDTLVKVPGIEEPIPLYRGLQNIRPEDYACHDHCVQPTQRDLDELISLGFQYVPCAAGHQTETSLPQICYECKTRSGAAPTRKMCRAPKGTVISGPNAKREVRAYGHTGPAYTDDPRWMKGS